jgi:hypothetical protein
MHVLRIFERADGILNWVGGQSLNGKEQHHDRHDAD